MSKETTPTTSESWNPTYSHENGLTPIEGLKVDDTYAFISEDLVDSVFVINPNAPLITESADAPKPASETETPKSDSSNAKTAESNKGGAKKSTSAQSPAAKESTATYTTAVTTSSEKTPNLSRTEKLRNWASNKLARAAMFLERMTPTKKEGRIGKALSKASANLLKWAHKSDASASTGESTEQPTEPIATKPIDAKNKDKKRNGQFAKLGKIATGGNSTEQQPDDGKRGVKAFFNRAKNNVEQESKGKNLKRNVGHSAVVAATLAGVSALAFLGPNYLEAKEARIQAQAQGRLYEYENTAIAQAVEVKGISKVVSAAGGNGEARPSAKLKNEQLEQGVYVNEVVYDANMGLDGSGPVHAQHSAQDGARGFLGDAMEAKKHNLDWQGVAYSWGNIPLAQAYYDAYHNDPALYAKMSENPPIMYGGPFGRGGFTGPYAKIATSLFGVNPDIAKTLPKGTTFVYSDRDPYATSGDGSQPLTNLFNLAMIPLGSHNQQNIDAAYITVEDADGNFHKITYFDAAAALGITGAGKDEINIAINKLFPVNTDPNSKERPRADVIGAIFYGAKGIDRMIDPTGNVRIFEMIQAQIPMEWKKLLDNGMNGINDAASAVLDAVNNPTPENIQKAFNEVLRVIGTTVSDLQAAMNRNLTTDVKNGGITVVSQLLSESLNLDYNTVRANISGFVNNMEQGAEEYKAKYMAAQAQAQQANAQAQARAQMQQQVQAQVQGQQQAAPTFSTDTGAVSRVPQYNAPVVPQAPANTGPMPKATVNTPSSAPAAVVEQAPVARQAESAPVQQQAPAVVNPVESAPVAPAPVEAAAPAPAPAAPAEPAPQAPVQQAPAAPVEVAPAPAPVEPAAPAPAPVESAPAAPVMPAAPVEAAPAPAPVAQSSQPAPASSSPSSVLENTVQLPSAGASSASAEPIG